MLRKGTLAVAIDGLNEVAHSPAVAAFAMIVPEDGGPNYKTMRWGRPKSAFVTADVTALAS